VSLVDSCGILDSAFGAVNRKITAFSDPIVSRVTATSGIRKERAMVETAEIPVEEQEQPPRWELAECSCPDWCERDHEQD
jgi:hypothetical protein